MAKDILIDIRRHDIMPRDITDSRALTYSTNWRGGGDDFVVLEVVVPFLRRKLMRFDGRGCLDILVGVAYNPVEKPVRVVLDMDGGRITLDGAFVFPVRTNSGARDIPQAINACQLPLVNIDGRFRLHFEKGRGGCEIFSVGITDMAIGTSDDQSAQLLMLTGAGKLYRYPFSGVGIYDYLNGVIAHSDLADKVDAQFSAEDRSVSEASFDSVSGEFTLTASEEAVEPDSVMALSDAELGDALWMTGEACDDTVRVTLEDGLAIITEDGFRVLIR